MRPEHPMWCSYSNTLEMKQIFFFRRTARPASVAHEIILLTSTYLGCRLVFIWCLCGFAPTRCESDGGKTTLPERRVTCEEVGVDEQTQFYCLLLFLLLFYCVPDEHLPLHVSHDTCAAETVFKIKIHLMHQNN